jgi:hypothetical protein
MPDVITEVYDRGNNGEYRIRREKGDAFSVYAKDELDAYTKGLAYIEKEEKEMRSITICVTIALLFFLSIITFACERRRDQYDTNMRTCIAAGKNYVSEDNDYSCRDAAAVPKAKAKEG